MKKNNIKTSLCFSYQWKNHTDCLKSNDFIISNIKNKKLSNLFCLVIVQPKSKSAKNDLKYFYHFKRIGYHLIHIFKDEELSRSTFEHAIECCVEAEDIKDVIMDVTFLSEEWAKELQDTWEVDISE